jgi:hypothetical protein
MHGFTTPRREKSTLGFFCSRRILPAFSIKLFCFLFDAATARFMGPATVLL